jgi:hypothetical protein
MRGAYWLAEQLLDSSEGICSLLFFRYMPALSYRGLCSVRGTARTVMVQSVQRRHTSKKLAPFSASKWVGREFSLLGLHSRQTDLPTYPHSIYPTSTLKMETERYAETISSCAILTGKIWIATALMLKTQAFRGVTVSTGIFTDVSKGRGTSTFNTFLFCYCWRLLTLVMWWRAICY